MKKSKNFLAVLVAITLCISSFASVAAKPIATDDGELFSFEDDFSEYKNVGTEAMPVYDFSSNWTAHKGDTLYPATIATDAPNNDGEKWMKLWAYGYWTNLTSYAGVGTDTMIPADSEQTISVRVRRDNSGQTAAVRFLDDGNGNYFQLTVPRVGESVTYTQGDAIANYVRNKYASKLGVTGDDISSINVSNFYTAWILSQCTVKDGVTTHEIIDIYEDPGMTFDAANKKITTKNVTVHPNNGNVDYDQIISVKTVKETGEITVDINNVAFGDTVYTRAGTKIDVKKTVYSENFKNSAINLCGVKLLARGQNNKYTYFTDFSVKAKRFPSLVHKVYEDNFSTYGDVTHSELAPSMILKDSLGNKINWKSSPKTMGFSQEENGVMVKYAKVGIPSVATGFNTPALSIEARSGTSAKNQYPTVVYAGEYPDTEGYHIKFRIRPSQCSGGIRIATDDTFSDYYEILLQAHSGIGIYKITDNKPTAYETLAFCNKESEIVKQHAGYSVPGSANIYDCELYIANGEIKFMANVLANPHHWTMDWMTVTDANMPLNLENAKVAFCAAGNMNQYVLFTDFLVESYDYWVNDKKEPTSVLYHNVAKHFNPDENGVIELENSVVIRRVISSKSGEISLSKDGKNYHVLGNGTDVVNTKSAAEFKFIKVPVGAVAKVYTNVGSKNIAAYQNTNNELTCYYNGNVADVSFDDGLSGSVATYMDGNVTIHSAPVTANKFKFTDATGGEIPKFTQAVDVAVISPFEALQKDGNLYLKLYTDTVSLSQDIRAIVTFADDNGKLIGIEFTDAEVKDGVVEFAVKDAVNAEKATAMLWSSAVGGYPVSEVYTIR